jgi:DNA-binding transcriptional LysR family regulator
MELRHLRYFVTVAELGSVSRAAEKLFIAQPPLSAQIKQLEEELGVALFVRLPRGVKLTSAGEAFIEDARAILTRAKQAGVRARERQAGHQTTVRIALVQSATHSLLPGLLERIRDEAINASVEVREMITTHQVRALRDGEIEFGISRPDSDELAAEIVAGIDDPYCLAIPKGNALAAETGPVALKRAMREPFVGFSRFRDRDYFDRTYALCMEAGFTPDLRHEASGFTSVLAMVALGLGSAIVPASCAMPVNAGVAVRRIQGSRYKSRLVIMRAERRAVETAVDRVTALAVEEMQRLGSRIR